MAPLTGIWRLLTPGQKRQLLWLQVVSLLMALSTVVGLASVIPFFSVLADPSMIERSAELSWLRQQLGLLEPRAFLVVLGGTFITLLVLSGTFNLFGALAMSRFAWGIGDHFRVALFNEYLHRDYLFHSRAGGARLSSSVLYESDRVTGMLQSLFVLSTNTVMIVLIVVCIGIVNPAVSAVMLALFVAGYAIVYGIARRRLLENGRAQTRAGAERVAVVEEGLGSIKDLLISHHQATFRSRFAEACGTISRVAENTQLIGQYPRHLLEAVAGVGLIVAALLMSERSGGMGTWLAELTFIGFACYRLLPAIQQSYFALVTIRANRSAFEHTAVDLAAALTAVGPDRNEERRDARPKHSIEMLDVSFRYSPDAPPAIDGVSLSIPAGSAVGFIGANGSGKTTAADLVLGLLNADAGRIEVDGVTLDASNVRAWQQSLAYVPQHIFLLDATIRANIALGVPDGDIDDRQLREAARLAGALEFIERLPRGFDEPLGAGGTRVSGGQRQRLGIARALYRNPSVLVLDEATSSLDPEAEQAVVQAVLRLRGTRTLIVIAHRPATVRACDRVYEFVAGRIVTSGTADALAPASSGGIAGTA